MKPDLMLTPLPAGKLPPWLLRKVLPKTSDDPDVLVGPGIGRDAAAIAIGDRVIVAKNDPITFAAQGAADHLVDVNANDIACMGAMPRWLLVTGLLPHGVTPADVLRDFHDLREACRRRGVELVGGHTEILEGLDHPILIGMMLGEATADELVRPGQARAGDALLLTKGIAIEGTALLARDRAGWLASRIGESTITVAARMLHDPGISVVRDAGIARQAGGVTALHDPTEGGLANAIREIAAASNLGVEVDRDAIPLFAETREIAETMGLDPLGMLASGALLIGADPAAVPFITRDLERAGIPVTLIGHLTDDPASLTMRQDGALLPLPEFAVDEVARALAETAA
ncbi:MAG: AIR synthase family protein [Thermomicrobiales bacterium]